MVIGCLIQQPKYIYKPLCDIQEIRESFTPKYVCQGWKTRAEDNLVKYYIVWCGIIASQDYYSKLHKDTTKNVGNFYGLPKYMLVIPILLWHN